MSVVFRAIRPYNALMKGKSTEGGFSLIEVLIATGLMGVLAVGMMSTMKMGITSQKSVNSLDEARVLTAEISSILTDSAACANTFAGANPSIAPGFSKSEIKTGDGGVVYRVGEVYGNKGLQLSEIRIGGTGTDNKLNLQRFTVIGPDKGLALVKLIWKKVGEQPGPADLQRFIFVHANLGAGGLIAACTSVGGLADELWKRNASDASKIHYIEGSVGIGVTDPAAKLDVTGEIKFGNSSIACDAGKEGQQRYNATTKKMEFCNGAAWAEIGGGGGALYYLSVCTGSGYSPCVPSCSAGYTLVNSVKTSTWWDNSYATEGYISVGICKK